jgi:hypothetical protein
MIALPSWQVVCEIQSWRGKRFRRNSKNFVKNANATENCQFRDLGNDPMAAPTMTRVVAANGKVKFIPHGQMPVSDRITTDRMKHHDGKAAAVPETTTQKFSNKQSRNGI